MSGPWRRLWRLRKLHQSIDAELRVASPDRPGANTSSVSPCVELLFVLNGRVVQARWLASEEHARDEASQKRAELERDGWMAHW
jgi:hypothetical protein